MRGGKLTHQAGEWLMWQPVSHQKLPWLTPAVCSAYRALLLAKKPEWYGRFGWSEEPNGNSKYIFDMIRELQNA
jgi:hypothetical protein